MTYQELVDKEEILLAKFRQMLFVQRHHGSFEFKKSKIEELNQFIVEDNQFFQSLNTLEIYSILKQIFPEDVLIERYIEKPEFDVNLRIFHHLYRNYFIQKKSISESDFLFLFPYRFLETYFSIPRKYTRYMELLKSFYSFVYNFPPLETMNYKIHLENWTMQETYLEFEHIMIKNLFDAWLGKVSTLDSFQCLDMFTSPTKCVFGDVLGLMMKNHYTKEEMAHFVKERILNEEQAEIVLNGLDVYNQRSFLSLVKKGLS